MYNINVKLYTKILYCNSITVCFLQREVEILMFLGAVVMMKNRRASKYFVNKDAIMEMILG